jgi:hypothetical protein
VHRRALILVLSAGCTYDATKPTATVPFSDDFERSSLGENWSHYGGDWVIDKGNVYSIYAINIPLFLNAELPADVVVEVDVKSETGDVDSKIELMADGKRHESGYIFILGGWNNSLSCIARMDEHGKDRKVKQPTGVNGNKWYRWRVEKKGGDIKWLIDGQPYIAITDEHPLDGPGHNRLAFNNWQNKIRFDNLKIWPYASAPAVRTSTRATTP